MVAAHGATEKESLGRRRNSKRLSVSLDSGTAPTKKGRKESKSPTGRHRSTEAAHMEQGHSPSHARDPFAGSVGDDPALSAATTPVCDNSAPLSLRLRWKKSNEDFRLSGGMKLKQLDGRTVLPILEGELEF